MNLLKHKDLLTALVFGSLAWCACGCSSWKQVADLSEIKRANFESHVSGGTGITFKTLDGCTYSFRKWRSDSSNAVIGEGAKKEGELYTPFSGAILIDSIAADVEILVSTRHATEYVLEDWTNMKNGDIRGKGYRLVHMQAEGNNGYETFDSHLPFEGVVCADSIATVKHWTHDPDMTRSAIIVGSCVGVAAVVLWISSLPIFSSSTF